MFIVLLVFLFISSSLAAMRPDLLYGSMMRDMTAPLPRCTQAESLGYLAVESMYEQNRDQLLDLALQIPADDILKLLKSRFAYSPVVLQGPGMIERMRETDFFLTLANRSESLELETMIIEALGPWYKRVLQDIMMKDDIISFLQAVELIGERQPQVLHEQIGYVHGYDYRHPRTNQFLNAAIDEFSESHPSRLQDIRAAFARFDIR